jgi:hypothetical protein
MRITLLMNSAPSCTHHNTTLRSPLSSINSLGCESYFTNTTTCVVGHEDSQLEERSCDEHENSVKLKPSKLIAWFDLDELDQLDKR